MSNTHLSGKKEIMVYIRRGWPILRNWIERRSFPARKIDGVWESDTALIDEWRRGQISAKKGNP